jgi:MCM AAA-lid domain
MTPWRMEKLRAYIMIVKERFQPTMTNDAITLLQKHYEKCRSNVSHTIPITVRFLESMIRLCQAHARLMYRNEVTLQDAVAVIQILECSAFAYGGFEGIDATDRNDILYCDPMTVDFSCQADLDFVYFEYRILQRYHMLNCMDPDRRNKALETFHDTTDDTTNENNVSWQQYEHGQIYQAPSQQQQQHFDITEMEPWTMPSQQSTTPYAASATQDHYGRVHPDIRNTQYNHQNHNKRSRK